MNVKKTALATAIALTMAGGSAWAETSTVKGQFILDKKVVEGGETVNLALLGLDKDGEVDRYGEEKGSKIMAVVNTIKGKIQGGSDRPGSTPDDPLPGRGYFASEVSYVELDQGVGRVNIYYPEEIVDADDTTDTVKVFLQERIPTPDGGVDFKRIGQPVEKTITIKASTKEPISFTIASFQPPNNDPILENDPDKKFEIPDPMPEDWGLKAEMTAGYSGALIKVLGDEDLQTKTRAALLVTLKVVEPNGGEPIYTDTQRMIRGEALFTLTAEIQKAGLYNLIVSLEGKEEINNIRLLSKDTLRVWPRKTPQKSKLIADKARITQGAAAVFTNGMCNGSQVCQGTNVTLTLLDEFGNEITPYTNLEAPLTVNLNDANQVVYNSSITLNPGMAKKMWVLGDQSGEIRKLGTTSLAATAGGLASSDALAIKVVNKSLKATPTDLFAEDQKAGTEFNAFTVVATNNAGGTLMSSSGTTDPGKIRVTTSTGEAIEVNRKLDDPVDVVEVFYKTVTPNSRYLLSDKGGVYGQVWVEASRIIPAAAFKVTLHNAIGQEITTIKPRYDLDEKRYVTKLPEVALRMQDAYGNEITENVGDFKVSTANATIKYVGTAGSNFGETGRDMGGKVHLAYNPTAFSGPDTFTLTFNKPALNSETLKITTAIPEALDTGLGSIKSFIETNQLPVNSEVALKVETLDKQDKLFINESLVVTVTFNEEEEALAEVDLDPESDEPDYIITPTVYELVTLSEDPLAQDEKFVASGGRLTFAEGRKLFVVEAGPRPGKFSLTFKDANNPSVKDVRIFTVTNEIKVETPITQEECLNDGNYWVDDAEVCQNMPEIGNPIAGKTTSGLVEPNGDISFTSNAHFKGGIAVGDDDIAQVASIELTPEGSNVLIAGNIMFDSDHDGETVDIVVVVNYQQGLFGGKSFWYSYGPAVGLVHWNLQPKNLETFKEHDVVKDQNLQVTIYDMALTENDLAPGTLHIYLGYRRDNGEIHFNGLPMTLHLQ